MFSYTVGSLCNLVLFSLAVEKLFNLMRSHLFILSFMSLALGGVSVRMLLHGMSEIFLPMFSSRTFMVSQLIFKYFIHLEFIFVYGVSWWSSFFLSFFFHVAVQISQHHLLKRLFLLHFMLLPPLSNINWPQRLGFISGLSVLFHWSVCFYASTRLFWLQWPCNTVSYKVLWSLLLCSSFSKLLQLFRVIYGSM